ncbi:hypothetical protein FSP39_001725 [Pinctada imbricata]|uniref:Uncharacterized protein n=1 Tax=Pinctada imbricata TaxID=66713 RepID=A0AA88Y796_PINIB|nr:hypothetical protein FSP39_001725 [Pinctada imbricata]
MTPEEKASLVELRRKTFWYTSSPSFRGEEEKKYTSYDEIRRKHRGLDSQDRSQNQFPFFDKNPSNQSNYPRQAPDVQSQPKTSASVGGYMGLFLGASILSVVELVELVILLITDVNSKKVNSKDRKDIGHKNSLKTLDAEQMPRATY